MKDPRTAAEDAEFERRRRLPEGDPGLREAASLARTTTACLACRAPLPADRLEVAEEEDCLTPESRAVEAKLTSGLCFSCWDRGRPTPRPDERNRNDAVRHRPQGQRHGWRKGAS